MARKKDDGAFFYLLFGLLGLALLSVFLINSFCVYHHYNKKFNFSRASARVTDTWNFVRFLPEILALGFVAYLLAGFFGQALQPLQSNANAVQNLWYVPILLILVLVLLVSGPFLLLSARLATTQAGLLIYRNEGFFVIPADWNKNTFTENIFHLEIIRSMYEMESLKLEDISKITRSGGKVAFIHGRFGTRRIAWRDKQKRDECIAALELACGRRLGAHI